MTKNDLPHAPPWGAKYKTRRALNGSGGGWPPWNTCGSLKQNKTKPKNQHISVAGFLLWETERQP